MALLGPLKTLMVGFCFFSVGCFYSAYFTVQVDLFHIALSRFLFGFGFVCYINPLFTISTLEIPLEKLPSATGLFHFVRSMMGGVGTSVFTTLWLRRTYFHHERIGETITPYNPMIPPQTGEQSLTLLNNALDQQAALLSINEVFFLMGWLFAGLVALLLAWTFFQTKKIRIG